MELYKRVETIKLNNTITIMFNGKVKEIEAYRAFWCILGILFAINVAMVLNQFIGIAYNKYDLILSFLMMIICFVLATRKEL